jgi:hypothetical protein
LSGNARSYQKQTGREQPGDWGAEDLFHDILLRASERLATSIVSKASLVPGISSVFEGIFSG